MNSTLVLLGVVSSVVVPLSVQADPESFRSSDNLASVKKAHKTATVAHADSDRATVYITNKSVTGSHLPLVVSRYHGRYDSMSPVSVYGRPDLDRTGQLNVQSELYQRDPAISSVGSGADVDLRLESRSLLALPEAYGHPVAARCRTPNFPSLWFTLTPGPRLAEIRGE